ncbi:redox-regulated ATPase YchF [Patescibacteria group bacterium]
MSLKIGIVGLPNVGKSTLFNALTKSSQAEASNYPFCTIDPNVGIITVPDKRLEKLGKLVKPEKVTPTAIEFVDIAGLVKDAHKGEGLGNQFLSHIKEVDLILQVVRFFEDDDIQHTDKTIDPLRDLEIINLELILADLSTIKNTLEKIEPKVRAGEKELVEKFDILKKIQKELEDGKMLNQLKLDNDEKELIKEFNFLTAKPFLYIANLSEDQLPKDGKLIKNGIDFIPISAKIEAEVNSLDGKEQKEYLESIGLKESGLNQVIKKSYQALGLITFFTAGPTEARAWTVKKGTRAPQAAGVIHTDFEKGFIKAEVISYEDFVTTGSELKAKEAGKMRIEGKDYLVQDGDVILFKV